MKRIVRGLVACAAALLITGAGTAAAEAAPLPPHCTFGWPSSAGCGEPLQR